MLNSDQPSPLPGKKLPPPLPKDADENSLKSLTAMKHFMSPTISAASKVNNQPSRKKILGERTESPIRSFKDGEENLLTNQESGRPDAGNLKKPISSSKQFFTSPPAKSTASKVNRPVAFHSSPRVLNFDLMKGEFGEEETDDWSPFSYDPVRNYLVPRPQFLRYRPNRLGLSPPSAKKDTDSDSEEDGGGSDDEFDDEEEFDEAESEGRSIWKRVFRFVLVFALMVLSTDYITSMNDKPVGIDDGLPNYAAVHLYNQEMKCYPVAFVPRLEVNGSWLSLDEGGAPSQLEMVKPRIPLDLDGGEEEVDEVMKEEIAEGVEVAMEDEVQEEEEVEEVVKKEFPEGEEVAMEDEVQEELEEEEGELLSFEQPLFLPLKPAAEEATEVKEEAQMAASVERAAGELVHYREIPEPKEDGKLENGKVLSPGATTTEVEEEKYDYMELDKKLTYDIDVDNRPFQGPMLAVLAVASVSVLALLLCCGVTRKKINAAARRNDALLPRTSSDSQPPPPHSEAPLLPSEDPVDALIPQGGRIGGLKPGGAAPRVELLGEIDGMRPRNIGGGTKSKPEKQAPPQVQLQPAAATAGSASRNSTTTKRSTSPSSSSSSRKKKEVALLGGEGEAKNSAAATTTPTPTPLRRSHRLASRGITSP